VQACIVFDISMELGIGLGLVLGLDPLVLMISCCVLHLMKTQDYSLLSYSFMNGCPFSVPSMYRFSASAQLMTCQMPWTYEALLLRYYCFISIEDGRWKRRRT
jgi:hypothetical protein